MSTPTRRSSRLQARDEGKKEREVAIRDARRRNSYERGEGRGEGALTSDSEGGSETSECHRPLFLTPIKPRATPKANNFLKVYHSYNRDCDDPGYDYYEGDFIVKDDDDERQLRERKRRRKRRRRREGSGRELWEDSIEDSSEGSRDCVAKSRGGGTSRTVQRISTSSGSEQEDVGVASGDGGRGQGSEDNEDDVMVTPRCKRGRRRQLRVSDQQSSEDSDMDSSQLSGGKRRKRCKILESDEEEQSLQDDTCRAPSSRVKYLHRQKEREKKGKLKSLMVERARQRGEELSDECDSAMSAVEKEEFQEEEGRREEEVEGGVVDREELVRRLLFHEPSSDEEEESDWIVSDTGEEDEGDRDEEGVGGAGEQEKKWEHLLSIKKRLFGVSPNDVEITLLTTSDPKPSTEGLPPLVYAAGCAQPSALRLLLPQSDLNFVASTLSERETTLLHLILEAPLQCSVGEDTSPLNASQEPVGAVQSLYHLYHLSCCVGSSDANGTSTLCCTGAVADDKGCTNLEQGDTSGTLSATCCPSVVGTPPQPHLRKGVESVADCQSLSCLKALLEYDRGYFKRLLAFFDVSCTVLQMAVWHRKPKCLRFLLSVGALPTSDGHLYTYEDISLPPSLLHLALVMKRVLDSGEENGTSVELLEILLPLLKDQLELQDELGYTPLMLAAESGDSAALHLLLEHGASLNYRDADGTSPLHLASLSGRASCVRLLIARGHPVDCQDGKGWPPLLYAHFGHHEECVLELMRAKPGQLSVLSELLGKTPTDGTAGREKTLKVIRSLLISLAHHEAYFSLFNKFIGENLGILEEDGFSFMTHCMGLLSFENKRAWLKRKLHMLTKHGYPLVVNSGSSEPSLLQLPRDGLLDILHTRLALCSAAQYWTYPPKVTFRGEAGVCTGPRKEFWACFSRVLADQESKLFAMCDNGQLSLQPCAVLAKYCPSLSLVAVERHKGLLYLVGKLMAWAVFHGDTLALTLTKPLLKQLLGCGLSHPDDLGDVDRELYHSLTSWEKEEGIAGLDLTFTTSLLSPWDRQFPELPLVEGGRSRAVTEDNKREYTAAMSCFKLETSVRDELEVFLDGFWKIIPRKCLQVFTPNELSLLISGVPEISVQDWHENTEYSSGVSPSDEEVQWFWRLVQELKVEERALLLKFTTGSPCVPAGGFADLQGLGGPTKFRISFMPGKNKIPQAATCFNNLRLSSYSCEQQLRDKTLIAIRYGCEGFEFA